MDWFGKSSKVEGKINNLESVGLRFEPIVFYPDRNEYELRIQLSDYPKTLIKVTYDEAAKKLKVQGQKQKTEFLQQFTIPADCLATGIYGRFRGDVLHIIMPRLLSEWPANKDPSSKQEDDQKDYSDRKSTEQAEQDREKLPAPPSDQKSTDEVRERGGDDHDELPASVPAIPSFDQKSSDGGGKERDELPASVPDTLSSEQKSMDDVKDGGEKDRDGLSARVPATLPSDLKSTDEVNDRGRKDRDGLSARIPAITSSDPKTMEELRQRDNELFPEITAPPPSASEPSRSVKELRENYQKKLSKIAAPPPPPPPPPSPSHAADAAPWNRRMIETEARKQEEEDREPPSDQKNTEQGVIEQEKPVTESPKKKRKSGKEVDENAKFVTGSKVKGESARIKSSAGGNEMFGWVAKVKETGSAAMAAAIKEENRLVVAIGAAVLAIVVIGASLRSSSKKTRN